MKFADRELHILRVVVDTYVRTGVPVSSRRIKESTGMRASTATIRGVLAGLEQAGYLTKPHTSAGRIPTDEGYRSYVDCLEPNQAHYDEFTTRFRDDVQRERELEVETIMALASRLLGTLSNNFAVVYGSVVPESRVSRVQLMGLEGSRLLVVVNLTPENERTVVLRLNRQFAADTVARAEAGINIAVGGRTLAEAKEALDSVIRDNMTDEGIITNEIAANRDEIFTEPPAVTLYFEERGHILEQPELSDPKLLQLLIRLMHDKRYLTAVLADRVSEGTRITIGGEHRDIELKPFSLVTSGYRMGGARGVLGIIGPTRMRYDLAWDLVGAAARELRAVGEEYF